MKKRWANRNLRREIREVDYWEKLTLEERKYLEQFMFEYYQGDFNFETPIHPNDQRKDCQNRNNASKRQVESVGQQLIDKAIQKARIAQYKPVSHLYYTPEDYIKNQEDETE